MTDAPNQMMYPDENSGTVIPSKTDAIGAELMYLHNIFASVMNDLIEKHNQVTDRKDEGALRNEGAINAFSYSLKILGERIQFYVGGTAVNVPANELPTD